MTSFSSLARPRRFWLSLFLLSLSAGLHHAPAHAVQVGDSVNAEFGPLVLGATCAFSDSVAGTLALDGSVEGAPKIGTEVGGTKAQYTYTASFTGAQILVDTPVAFRNGSQFIPATNTIYASRNGSGATPASGLNSVVLNNDLPLSDTLNVGLVFSPEDGENSFEPGSYTARVTITCTDNGAK